VETLFHRSEIDRIVYYARKGGSSVFWIINEKDAIALKNIGYEIRNIFVPKDFYPIVYTKLNGKLTLEIMKI
jgi:hypothetical protein